MSSRLTPSAVIKGLRTGVDDGRKIQLARAAYEDDKLALPRKVDVLLEFALDRLLKGRLEKGPHAPLFSLDYWRLFLELADASPTSLPSILARIPTLPTLNSVLGAEQKRLKGASEVLPLIVDAFRITLPTAIRRATLEHVIEAIVAAFGALERVDEQEALTELVILTLREAESALSAAGQPGRKKPFLDRCLPKLVDRLVIDHRPSLLRQQLLSSAQQALFSLSALSKTVEPVEVTENLRSAVQQRSEDVAVLPLVFDLYIAALRKHASAIFPLPSRANVPTSDQQSRSAIELHQLANIRAAAFTVFSSMLDMLPDGRSGTAALDELIRVLANERMYSLGATEGSVKLLQTAAKMLISTDLDETSLHTLSTLLNLDFEALRPVQSDLLRQLSRLHRLDQPAVAFVTDLLAYYAKTRQLPDYLHLLCDTLSSLKELTESPLTLLTLLQSQIKASLGPAQITSTIESLAARLLACNIDESSEPPKKKRKKATESSSTSVGRLATALVVSATIESIMIPKPARSAIATSLKGIVASERVQDALARLAKGEVDGEGSETVAALLLARAARSRAVELGDDGLKTRLDEALIGGLTAPALPPAVALEIMLSELNTATCELVCARAADILARPSKSWRGQVFGIEAKELPTALWHLISFHLGSFEQHASNEQRVTVSKMLLDVEFATAESPLAITKTAIVARMFASAEFYELPRLRTATLAAMLAKAQTLKRKSDNFEAFWSLLAAIPMQYFPLDHRRKLLALALEANVTRSSSFVRRFALAATRSDSGSIMHYRDMRFLEHLAKSADDLDLFKAGFGLCLSLWKGEPSELGRLAPFISVASSHPPALNHVLDTTRQNLMMAILPVEILASTREAVRAACEGHLASLSSTGVGSAEDVAAVGTSFSTVRALWASLLWLGVEADELYARLAVRSASTLSEVIKLLSSKSVPFSDDALVALLELVAFRFRLNGTTRAAEAFLAVYFVLARSAQDPAQLDQVLAKTLSAAGDAYSICLSILEQRLASETVTDAEAARTARTITIMLEHRPSGSASMAREMVSRVVRLLASLVTHTELDLLSAIIEALEVIGQRAHVLLERSDTACILATLACIQRANISFSTRIATILTRLLRRRVDLVTSLFPSFARLTAQLLVSAPEEAVGRLLANMGEERALAGALSKHAPFILVFWLRAGGPGRAILGPATNGLAALLSAMGTTEREALMSGFLVAEEEAERALLRSLWREYDRSRYRGGA